MTRLSSVTGHAGFADLSRHGVSVRGRTLRIRCAPLMAPDGEEVVELAFAVNRRFGKAVERNRARRRIREAFRQIDLFPGRYLISANRGVLDLDFQLLKSECSELIDELRLRCQGFGPQQDGRQEDRRPGASCV